MCQIMLEAYVSVNSKPMHMRAKSEVWVMPSYFDESKGEIKVSKKTYGKAEVAYHIEQQKRLGEIIHGIQEARNALGRNKSAITKDWLANIVYGINHPNTPSIESMDFWAIAQRYLEKSLLGENTKKAYIGLFRIMYRYEQYKRTIDKEEFTWRAIDTLKRSDLDDFKDYMAHEHELASEFSEFFNGLVYPQFIANGKKNIRARGEHLLAQRMKSLRILFNYLVNNDIVSKSPFNGYTIKAYKYQMPYYLSMSERDTLASAPMPTKQLELVRDIFVFQCYIGARVSDLEQLTYSNINDGKLTYTPIKTASESTTRPTIKLLPKPLEILAKYKGVGEHDRLFPYIKRERYNELIKVCFEIAGLTRSVSVKDPMHGTPTIKPLNELASSHLARRTFVGILQEQGVPLQVVASMSGHSPNSSEIARYYSVSDSQREQSINCLESNDGTEKIDITHLSKEKIAAIKAIIEGRG